MFIEKTISAMDSEAMNQYKEVLYEDLERRIEEDPDILELEKITGDLIVDMVTKTPDDILRQVIRENLAQNAHQTVEDLKGTLDEVAEVVNDLSDEDREIYEASVKAGMDSIQELWTHYESMFVELIHEMSDEMLADLQRNASDIAEFISGGGIIGTPIEAYIDLLEGTWKATEKMASEEIERRMAA